MKIQLLLSSLALGFITFTSHAQSGGELVPDYGVDGRFIADLGFQDNLETVAQQADGKVVAAGTALSEAFAGRLLILRTNVNGTPDTDFGDNGEVLITDFTESYAYKLLIQQDGKIVVCGAAANAEYVFSMLFLRLNTDGTIDTSFGDNGFVTTDFYPGDEFCYGAILVDGDKIVGVGQATLANFQRVPVIVRLTADGDIDTAFGVNGVNLAPVANEDNIFYDVKEDSQGNLIACGYYGNGITIDGQIDHDYLMTRFDATGAIDINFGEFGSVVIPGGSYIDVANALALDGNDNAYLAGYTTLPDFSLDAVVLAFDSNGDLIQTFGENGIKTFSLNPQDVFNDIFYYGWNLYLCGTSGGFFFDDRDFLYTSFTAEAGMPNPLLGGDYSLISIIDSFDDANAMVLDPAYQIVYLAGRGNNGSNNDAAITAQYHIDMESVSEIENNLKLSIFPNPAVDGMIQLNLENSAIENITIFDGLGKICYQIRGNSRAMMQLSLPELNAGVYSIRVQTREGNQLTERLVIK